jgi:ankyrin repeat protein
MNGCVEVVKVLLEFGAQVDLPNYVRRHYELMIILMYIAPQDERGNAALSRACAGGYVETARVLLDHGAYVDQQNKVFEFYY